jgi:hypothetical protein
MVNRHNTLAVAEVLVGLSLLLCLNRTIVVRVYDVVVEGSRLGNSSMSWKMGRLLRFKQTFGSNTLNLCQHPSGTHNLLNDCDG